jgi:hypothetical protein
MKPRTVWLLMVAFAAIPGMAMAATNPVPSAAPAVCTPGTPLKAYAKFLQSAPILTKSVTRFLPDDATAKLYFHHALGTGASGGPTDSFSIFESPWLQLTWLNNNALLPLVSVASAPVGGDPDFLNTDSVQLQFEPLSNATNPWRQRSFIVIDCEGTTPVAWGSVRVSVADSGVTAEICIVLAIAVYVACMLCLQDKRKPGGSWLFRKLRMFWRNISRTKEDSQAHLERQKYFATTYPSIYKRQELGFLDLFNPIHLTVNDLGEPSVQKFQVILFSSLVVGLLLDLVLRVGNLVSLSGSVVGLIGISGVSAAASAGVSQQNKRLSFDNWAWLQDQKILINTDAPLSASWGDLITSNHEFDVYKMQAMVFSVVVAVALFIAGAGGELDTFTVPDALLGVLGLSQVTYIGGLLAQPPSVADLDTALTKLRNAQSNYEAAVNQGTDVDNDGHLLPTPAVAPPKPGFNAKAQFNKQVKTIVPMIESALEVQVNRDAPALRQIT